MSSIDESTLLSLLTHIKEHSLNPHSFPEIRESIKKTDSKLQRIVEEVDKTNDGFTQYFVLLSNFLQAKRYVVQFLENTKDPITRGVLKSYDTQVFSTLFEQSYSAQFVFDQLITSFASTSEELLKEYISRLPKEYGGKYVYRPVKKRIPKKKVLKKITFIPKKKERIFPPENYETLSKEDLETLAYNAHEQLKSRFSKDDHTLDSPNSIALALDVYKPLDYVQKRVDIANTIEKEYPELAKAIAISGFTVLGLKEYWKKD